jgi:hypothetical protein
MGNTSSQHVLAIKPEAPSNKQGLLTKGNRKICLNTRSCVFIYDKCFNEDIQLQLKKSSLERQRNISNFLQPDCDKLRCMFSCHTSISVSPLVHNFRDSVCKFILRFSTNGWTHFMFKYSLDPVEYNEWRRDKLSFTNNQFFLCQVTQLWKGTINFVMSVCLSAVRPAVRLEQLGSHQTDFH